MRVRTKGSLISQTIEEMQTDADFIRVQKDLVEKGQKYLTKEERTLRRRTLTGLGLPSFTERLSSSAIDPLQHQATKILQINLGLFCNQACSHCHVESSPLRTEMMDAETVDQVLCLLRASPSVETVDITGGAPELMPEFRRLVTECRSMGLEVIDRCNLTVLQEDSQADLARFLADQQVRVVASLPCYSAKNVDLQRGRGVFEKSIVSLLELNDLGYGKEGSGLTLDLVYNPGGAFLPPDQATLQAAYRSELREAFGIEFSNLFTITNMPIKRYADYLSRRGELESYMQLLVENFNPTAVAGVMCKELVSVQYDGRIYDCDFNQQLDMPMPGKKFGRISDLQSLDDLIGNPITVDSHCYGCTAGSGSS